jgi:hypothetical protein
LSVIGGTALRTSRPTIALPAHSSGEMVSSSAVEAVSLRSMRLGEDQKNPPGSGLRGTRGV